MSKKAEIKKIVLDLGNKEIELTIGQAKKLNAALGEMFDEKTVYVDRQTWPIVIERHRPYWIYSEPQWTYSPNTGTASNYQMSYTGETQTMSLSIGD